ncbi:hypothetical protein DFS33DRAFT_1269251 [Desarmillaria ectypa]|nr:hypothetical protein DFS33DRAFT_1269251 [Desarmillaria ectypa]
MVGLSEKFSQYVVYKPSGGDTIVKSGRSTIYSVPGDQAFYASVDTYLVDTMWHKTELRVTEGSEITQYVGISGIFKGLTMSMDGQTKEFTSYETTETQTKTITLNVPAKGNISSPIRCSLLDAWNEEWNAGTPRGYNITKKECEVEIMSEDYLTTDVPLMDSATGTMDVTKVSRGDSENLRKTRKRENLTQKAKDELSKMGV